MRSCCPFFLLTVCLFLSCATYSQQPTSLQAREILQKANDFFEKEQCDSALHYYKEFLFKNGFHLDKDNPELSHHAGTLISRETYSSCIRIAICFNLQKKYDSALQILKIGLKEVEGSKKRDHGLEALFCLQVANAYNLKGETRNAEFWYQESLVRSDGRRLLMADVYQNLGGLYFFKEDYERAIQFYQKALIICIENPATKKVRIFDLLTSLGTAFSGKEDFRNSLSCFMKADSVLRNSKIKDKLRLAGLNINLGEVFLKLDEPIRALNRYKKASELATGKTMPLGDLAILSEEGIAECYSRFDQVDSAMYHFSRVLDLVIDTNRSSKHTLSRIYQKMGDLLSAHNEKRKAIEFYDKAISTISSSTDASPFIESDPDLNEPDLLELSRSLECRGKCLYQIARENDCAITVLERSCSDFLSALRLCQLISQDLGQENSRMFFHESSKSVLAGVLESGFLLWEKNGTSDFIDLFSLTDSNRNKILLESLKEKHVLKIAGVPDTLTNRLTDLRNEIVFYARKLVKWESSTASCALSPQTELLDKVIDLKMRLDSLQQQVNKTYPDYHNFMHQNNGANSSRILLNLRDDEALLEYFYLDSVIFIFLLKNNGLSLRRVLLSSSFKEDFREVLGLLKSAGTQNYLAPSHRLYNDLIAPVRSQITGIRHLIIIPDEKLVLLPFEALIAEKPEKAAIQVPSSWHFLVKDFEISYHFSAAAWLNSAERPWLSATESSFAGYAPRFKYASAKPGVFSDLPYAEQEVREIGRLFNTLNGHSQTFAGASATEKNFREHAGNNSVVHVATHSLIDDADPGNTALVFSPGNNLKNIKDMDDGFLHLDEISNLRLNASLVVLSACSSGKGKVTRTEGVLALSRGFYIAGAGNILYSLWNIPDRFTGNFMPGFYRGFLSGKSYSTALREAKLNMIADPSTSLPYLWAGFVMLGR